MTVGAIRERLAAHQPALVEDAGHAHAAVAIVLRDGEEGAELVMIRRAHREGDPWSGHMALPGGRQDPTDSDLFTTAARETFEEVGIDLRRHGELLGHLDELRAIGRGRPLDLIITPFVCAVDAPVTLAPNEREVQHAFWLPLAALRRRETLGSFRHEVNGQPMEHQAFIYEAHTIWGITYRILTRLLEVVA
jgi:8-oxo-dGTP pyrophosphatase MutT (NUDIX family)